MCAIGYRRALRVERMGRVAYAPMHALQEQRHAQVRDGTQDDTLFLLEHEPVITLGRNSSDEHVLVPRNQLQALGIDLFKTGRGGDVTYHGPGQIVGYPIIKLDEEERDVVRYVGYLEEAMIRTARDFGVRAERVPGLRGIWVGNDKIGAVGVRVAEWVTLHGFAFNVSTTPADFSAIVPCGLHGRGVTSLRQILGEPPSVDAVMDRLAVHAGDLLVRETYDAARSSCARVLPSEASTCEAVV